MAREGIPPWIEEYLEDVDRTELYITRDVPIKPELDFLISELPAIQKLVLGSIYYSIVF